MVTLKSYNPATNAVVWEGEISSFEEIEDKIKKGQKSWGPLEKRIEVLEHYAQILKNHLEEFAETISKETGKPLWESKEEVRAMIGKIPISIHAYQERCGKKQLSSELSVSFKPHGLVAVFGPFNFPGHLPNGHIVPALLAGNTVIFKPSELTPWTGELMQHYFEEAEIPQGVFQVVQGGKEVGEFLATAKAIKGIFFTGSARVGEQLKRETKGILALEMGGNNPLVISKISNLPAAAELTIRSAFLTTGQRCSAARRLILTPDCPKDFLQELIRQIKTLKIGAYNESEEPFMGPVIHSEAAKKLMLAQESMQQKGANTLYPMQLLRPGLPFVSPALIDTTSIEREDEEYFGPLLQVIHAHSLEEAIAIANETEYGLTAGLFSHSEEEWNQFFNSIQAGVINWNSPLTGASSRAPFGGIGKSGNYRPSAYLAADYCSYPVTSTQFKEITP